MGEVDCFDLQRMSCIVNGDINSDNYTHFTDEETEVIQREEAICLRLDIYGDQGTMGDGEV